MGQSEWLETDSPGIFGDSKTTPLFLAATLTLSILYAVAHGVEYVAWPKLNKDYEAFLEYDGKGYESGRHGRAGRSKRRSQSGDWKRQA